MNDQLKVLNKENNKTVNTSNDGIFDKIVSLVEMVKSAMDGKYSFSMKFKVIGVLSALYLISPIDLLPEMLLGPLGFIDDAAVMAIFWKVVQNEISGFTNQKVKSHETEYEIINP